MATITHWKRHVKRNLLSDSTIGEQFSGAVIKQLCQQAGHRWRESFWCPATTLVTFLLQVLNGAKTLRAAVALLLTQLAARDQSGLASADPSAYCQARIRLPHEVVTGMLGHVAGRMQSLVSQTNAWLGRRVWVVDGSSVSMPDTPRLQQAFPQPPGQAPGCGFPVAQFVALFCWTTGAIIDLVIDTLRPHELNLVRRLYHHFQRGDVVLADRAYAAFVDIVRLLEKGVYCVFRLHQRRKADFRAGRRLGPDDRLVTWQKPAQWLASFGISKEEFERLPQTLTVRLVRISQAPRGVRSRTIVVVTTLVDPIETPADEIRALYRDRWTAELNLRSLKISLGMDVLRSQSPEMIRKEIAMHLLAYNLIRLLMWQAARQYGRNLHRLSFTGTLHRLQSALPLIVFGRCLCSRVRLWEFVLASIAADEVPDRPDRIEPRRVKRRPKQYSRLIKPRSWYRCHTDLGAR
jgi:hypothetical protein